MKIPAGLSPALALTEEWHNDTYPAISPTRPELSAKGKTIVITGGGSGIGAETVRAFALAGAATIAILGRREQLLLDTKSTVEKEFPATKIDTYAADVCNEGDLQRAAKRIGAWDVLVQNAGYMAKRGKIAESDVADWWKAFEVNVKGFVVAVQAFLPTKSSFATIIGVSTCASIMPAPLQVTYTSYATSKLALVKLVEILQHENPDMRIVSIHPGLIATEMFAKSEMQGLPIDDVKLPAHFSVWLASKEADFIKGHFVVANWDVTELKAKAARFEEPGFLAVNVIGLC